MSNEAASWSALLACPAFPLAAYWGAETTTALNSAPNSSVYGQQIALTATVTPSVATGTVTVHDGGSKLDTAPPSGRDATLSTSDLAVGDYRLEAVDGAGGMYDGSTPMAIIETVSKPDTTLSVASFPYPSVAGETVTFTATVSLVAPGWGTRTGTVDFYANRDLPAEDCSLSSGVATCSKSFLPVEAPVDIVAYHDGNGYYAPSDNVLDPLTQTANRANTFTPIDSSAGLWFGQSYTASGTVGVTSPGTGTPTGTMSLDDGGGESRAANLVTGAWSPSPSLSGAAGTQTLTAAYEGDESRAGPTVSMTHQVSTVATTLAPTDGCVPAVIEKAVSVTATATAAAGGGNPRGRMSFSIGSDLLGNAILVSSGADESGALFVTAAIPVGGTQTITVLVSDAPLVVGDGATGMMLVEGIPTKCEAPLTDDVTVSRKGDRELGGDPTPEVTYPLTTATNVAYARRGRRFEFAAFGVQIAFRFSPGMLSFQAPFGRFGRTLAALNTGISF